MSTTATSARIQAASAAIAAFGAGWWVGEDPGAPILLTLPGVVLVALVALSVAARFEWPSVRVRVVVILGTITAAAGLLLGGEAGVRAFNQCVDEAEPFREVVVRLGRANKRYPNRLEEVGSGVPCQRPLRGTLLNYKTNGEGFSLEFRDWLVTHSGSDTAPMRATK